MVNVKDMLNYLYQYYEKDHQENVEKSIDSYGNGQCTVHNLYYNDFNFDIHIEIADVPLVNFEFIFKNDVKEENMLDMIYELVQITSFGVYVNEDGLMVLKDVIHRIDSLDGLMKDIQLLESNFFAEYTQKNLKRVLKKMTIAA